jgi:hypothetical protein
LFDCDAHTITRILSDIRDGCGGTSQILVSAWFSSPVRPAKVTRNITIAINVTLRFPLSAESSLYSKNRRFGPAVASVRNKRVREQAGCISVELNGYCPRAYNSTCARVIGFICRIGLCCSCNGIYIYIIARSGRRASTVIKTKGMHDRLTRRYRRPFVPGAVPRVYGDGRRLCSVEKCQQSAHVSRLCRGSG